MRDALLWLVIIILLAGSFLTYSNEKSNPVDHMDREPHIRKPTDSWCVGKGDTRYDLYFKIAGRHLEVDGSQWCDIKVLCTIESGLDPEAKSDANAFGLCQLLQTTFDEQLPRGDIWKVGDNIDASAIYLDKMLHIWHAPRPANCRTDLAVASYNSGPGPVIEGQVKSGGQTCISTDWELFVETFNHVQKFKKLKADWGGYDD